MNTNIRDTIINLIAIKKEQKVLEEKAKELTEILKAKHNECGADVLCVDGYISSISHANRQVLIKENIEKLLGHELPADCIRITSYDMVKTCNDAAKAQKLISESKAIEL